MTTLLSVSRFVRVVTVNGTARRTPSAVMFMTSELESVVFGTTTRAPATSRMIVLRQVMSTICPSVLPILM